MAPLVDQAEVPRMVELGKSYSATGSQSSQAAGSADAHAALKGDSSNPTVDGGGSTSLAGNTISSF